MNNHSLHTAKPTALKQNLVAMRACILAVAACISSANAGTISWDATYFNDAGLSAGDYATFQSVVNSGLDYYSSTFSSPNSITVAVQFHAGTTGLGTTSGFGVDVGYQDYRNALAATGNSANDALALTFLPNVVNNPVNGSSGVKVTPALGRALGLFGNLAIPYDASMILNVNLMTLSRVGPMTPGSYDLTQVLDHELNEVLGFGSALNGTTFGDPVPTGSIGPADLFRYNGLGSRSFNTSLSDGPYLSIDGGATKLAEFNTAATGDRHDFNGTLNGSPSPSVQDAFSTSDVRLNNGVAEITALDVIGYNIIAVPEPATNALLAVGALTAFAIRKKVHST